MFILFYLETLFASVVGTLFIRLDGLDIGTSWLCRQTILFIRDSFAFQNFEVQNSTTNVFFLVAIFIFLDQLSRFFKHYSFHELSHVILSGYGRVFRLSRYPLNSSGASLKFAREYYFWTFFCF